MRLQPTPIQIVENEREELEKIANKRTESHQLVVRSKIILLASEGKGIGETVRALGVNKLTVLLWRRRWLERSLDKKKQSAREVLSDRPKSGKPAKYSPEQVCAIVAIACEDPKQSGWPITHWTQAAIAKEAVKRGICEQVSNRAIGHFLKRGSAQASSHEGLAQQQTKRRI